MGLLVNQQIIGLNQSHLSDIEILLQKCELPFEDCYEHLNNFYGITNGDRLCAIGALQNLGSVALLRSIAVHPNERSKGLAAVITRYLLGLARSEGITELYLLTESAEGYFARFEFRPVERSTAPEAIKYTRQFTSLCPSNAQLMHLNL